MDVHCIQNCISVQQPLVIPVQYCVSMQFSSNVSRSGSPASCDSADVVRMMLLR